MVLKIRIPCQACHGALTHKAKHYSSLSSNDTSRIECVGQKCDKGDVFLFRVL